METQLNVVIKTSLLLFLTILVAPYAYASCQYGAAFVGKEVKIGNVLNWKTLSEEDNQFFIVEKSFDGIEFGNAGVVKGAGTTNSMQEYSFLDLSTNAPMIFYRLKQVDFDGKETYTQVIAIHRETSNKLMVEGMSSPLTDAYFGLYLLSQEDAAASYSVSLKGEIVLEGTIMLEAGSNTIDMDLSKIRNGIYDVEVVVGEERENLIIRKIDAAQMPTLNFAKAQKDDKE